MIQHFCDYFPSKRRLSEDHTVSTLSTQHALWSTSNHSIHPASASIIYTVNSVTQTGEPRSPLLIWYYKSTAVINLQSVKWRNKLWWPVPVSGTFRYCESWKCHRYSWWWICRYPFWWRADPSSKVLCSGNTRLHRADSRDKPWTRSPSPQGNLDANDIFRLCRAGYHLLAFILLRRFTLFYDSWKTAPTRVMGGGCVGLFNHRYIWCPADIEATTLYIRLPRPAWLQEYDEVLLVVPDCYCWPS